MSFAAFEAVSLVLQLHRQHPCNLANLMIFTCFLRRKLTTVVWVSNYQSEAVSLDLSDEKGLFT